ncbi:MAG: dihydrofolate reductase [Nevskiales bacterium]
MSHVSLIVAADENNLIGADNRLPWHLPADLKHFKQVTMGKPMLMGRKTLESIGRPLPGRRSIVLTRVPGFTAPGCEIAGSLEQALLLADSAGEIMVIGGAEIFQQALPRASRIYMTRVHGRFEGDTYFPELEQGAWRETSRETHTPDDKNLWPYSFVVLERSY